MVGQTHFHQEALLACSSLTEHRSLWRLFVPVRLWISKKFWESSARGSHCGSGGAWLASCMCGVVCLCRQRCVTVSIYVIWHAHTSVTHMHNSVFSSVCAIMCSLICVSVQIKVKRLYVYTCVCLHMYLNFCLPQASSFPSLTNKHVHATPLHPWEDPGSPAQLSSSLGMSRKDRQTDCSSTPEARPQHPCTASLFVSWSVASAPTIHVMTKEQRDPALSKTVCQNL